MEGTGGGGAGGSSGDSGGCGGGGPRGATRRRHERPYKGIRMRKWGKWVAEIREPNKRSRIWLGSYSTAVAAARAYDTAVYCLRGPTVKLNFPEEISAAGVGLKDLSAASIRKRAAEVGARVDAIETGFAGGAQADNHGETSHESGKPSQWYYDQIDLNKKPKPEPEDHSTVVV